MKKKPTQSLPDLADEYLKTEFSERAINTIRNNTFYLKAFVAFIGRRKIDRFSYQDWTKHAFEKWAPQTAKTLALAASSRFLNWMERCEHIDRSPHRLSKKPIVKAQPIRQPFTAEEFEKLKASAQTMDASMYWAIICGWETGMSICDVSLLTWENVSIESRIVDIHRKKTHERCIIPLPEDGDCIQLLKKKSGARQSGYPNNAGVSYVDTDLCLLYKRGAGEVQLAFRKVRDKAGVDESKTFHNLRASFCSRLANAGIQTTLACQMSGHKNPAIFAQYVTPNFASLHEQAKMAWDRRI